MDLQTVLEAEKAQPWDASGKEKSNMTHTKLSLNPWGSMKNRSDYMSDCKDSAGTHNWQLQNYQHNRQTHAAEYHQKESWQPKADVKGNWETSVSENPQISEMQQTHRKVAYGLE